MRTRRPALALGIVVLGVSGVYVFVYLYRWEWNRALFCLGLFVAVEVAMGVGVVLSRLKGMSERIDRGVLARIEESAPPPSRPFAWLTDDNVGRTAIFVPVLMGAGIVLSGVAWLVERLASATAGPVLERGLARQLSALSLPDSLVPAERGRSLFRPTR